MPGPRRSEFSAPEPVLAPHPEPEVRARPAAASEIPGGAKALVNAARKAGWPSVTVDYARGYVKHATQDSFILKHSIVVRIGIMPGRPEAVAVYTAPVSRPDAPPARYAHAGTLLAILGAHRPASYTSEALLVRPFLGVHQGHFSSKEFKAWLRFTPEPRPFAEIEAELDRRAPR